MPDKDESFRRLLYSGMTRATVRLDLVVKADNPLNEPFLGQG
jgi:hypothetical protein